MLWGGRRKGVTHTLTTSLIGAAAAMGSPVGFWRADQHRVVCMRLYMLLQVLRALEGLATEVTFVRLQRYVHANVRGDVVTLDRRGTAISPLAGQIEVVGTFTANMSLANVVLVEVSGWSRDDVYAGVDTDESSASSKDMMRACRVAKRVIWLQCR